jgi:putative membrane protein
MKKSLKLPTVLIYTFLVILTTYFITKTNYEFIGYAVVVGFLYYIVIRADKKYNFPASVIWLFAIWIAMHMLGGSVYINGTRLYDLVLINMFNGGGEFMLLKYDQFVHAYCYFAISILMYFVLKKHMKSNQGAALVTFTILSAIGIGLLNEVIELAMVVFADAAEAVGGYYNTALDLVFNLIGAIIGSFYAYKIIDKKK